MGSTIACHFANIGLDVLMLDITIPAQRNRIVNTALKTAIKSKPAPLYKKEFASRIRTGNFDDDFAQIADCDWIIEVVIERLDIKQQIFEKVEKYRQKGTLVTSNTSGIPIHLMTEGRSDDFKKNFLGTHFFNPPRYLELFEVIPTPDTDPAVVDFFMKYGSTYLGKQSVLAKDTPAFIANRVGVYAMAKIYELAEKLELNIEDVDKLTGPALARPGTGTFRLGDLVGMDTAAKVIAGMKQGCPDDEQIHAMAQPKFFDFLLENKYYGNKSGQGFYKKTGEKDERGKSIIHGLDLKTLTYRPKPKSTLASLKLSKQIENPKKRVKAMFDAEDKGGELVRESLAGLFAYVSNRIPEISDNIYSIDQALRAGFAWDFGPFEYWDIVGLEKGYQQAFDSGYPVADWIKTMIDAGHTSFYKVVGTSTQCYNPSSASYEVIPGADNKVVLDNYRSQKAIYENDDVVLHDIGDQVLCLEFRSKMNAIGEGILTGLNAAIDIAEEGDWRGIVIGNNAKNFTVGANLMMIGMMAFQQQFDELNQAVALFQNTVMRCRFSKVPIVAATQGYVFGGGCETIMHCDSAIVAAESYIGLVEVGVGLIPGGAGTKEFALRASDQYFEGDVQIPTLIEKFKTIAMASVATSGYEAFDHGYLLAHKDTIEVNKHLVIAKAKHKVIDLSENYTPPTPRQDVKVLGRSGLGALYTAAHSLQLGKYATDHDIVIAKKIAWVLCGGDLSEASQVSEQYLLDLEREAFLSLCGEQKTMERIQYMLEKNKPLRN
ncbi:UNVERIFIED_CONTAM: hypothetical protein GTU68_053987 [Idotea baltica]|nr:hypothetical protein [Idotea baltica]